MSGFDDAFLGKHDDRGFVDPVQPGKLALGLAAFGFGLVDSRADFRGLSGALLSGRTRQLGGVGRIGAIAVEQCKSDGQMNECFRAGISGSVAAMAEGERCREKVEPGATHNNGSV